MTLSTSWQERYIARFYDRERGWIDGTTEFYDLCSATIPPASRILEVGGGPSNKTSRFLAGLGEVHGVDLDPAVLTNDALASAEVLIEDDFPYAAESFDACVSSFVIEHVAVPVLHLRQVQRVLKPGAPYIIRTPNVNHFVYRISSLTPHAFHRTVANRLRNLPPDAHDPYPTVYGMNSARKIFALAGATGFSVDVLRIIEKNPAYGMSSRTLFLLFMAYERTVNSTEHLARFRATILSVLRREP